MLGLVKGMESYGLMMFRAMEMKSPCSPVVTIKWEFIIVTMVKMLVLFALKVSC